MKYLIIIFFFFNITIVNGQSFTEVVKAVASDRGEDDRLGYAVAIDGDYAVVGAYADDFGPTNPNMGSVYVYEQIGQNNWVEIQKLSASDQEDYDRFGYAVAISGDYIIVGAYGEDDDEFGANPLSKAGSAYIFEKDIAGVWVEVQKIVASDRDADDEFGWSVAIDGSTAVIGAHIEDHDENGLNYVYHTGSVYVFDRDGGGVWNQTQKLVAQDRAADMNYPDGYSGEDLADQFGGSVDIWNDYMIVGAHHHDYGPSGPPSGALWSSGAAYIFERNAGVWTQVQKIQNFDRESWDRFGYTVSVDSINIAVGAYSEDELEDGVSGALTNPGSVYIFERDGGGVWNPVQKIVPLDRNSGDHFGYSIEIEDSLMVIGTHSDDHDETGGDLLSDAGSVYIFENNAGVWSQFQKIDASDRKIGDELGVDVGISGNTIIAGALYQDFNDVGLDSLSDAGAAYFYSNFNCTPESSDIYVSICNGDTYYIGGFAYSSSGNYLELFTGVNGCDSSVITHLTVESPITSEQYVSVCFGETYTIGTSTYSVNGTYEDIVTASNFCDSIITTHLTIELPVDASISQSVNMLISNSDGPGYQWFDCNTGLPIAGATDQVFFAENIGSYGVIATENGCSDTSGCVYVSYIADGVEPSQLDAQIIVYPNPNNGYFEIDLGSFKDSQVNVELINGFGEVIIMDNFSTMIYSFDGLVSGIYFAKISIDNSIITKRIIVL